MIFNHLEWILRFLVFTLILIFLLYLVFFDFTHAPFGAIVQSFLTTDTLRVLSITMLCSAKHCISLVLISFIFYKYILIFFTHYGLRRERRFRECYNWAHEVAVVDINVEQGAIIIHVPHIRRRILILTHCPIIIITIIYPTWCWWWWNICFWCSRCI